MSWMVLVVWSQQVQWMNDDQRQQVVHSSAQHAVLSCAFPSKLVKYLVLVEV
jgi:hypothetical protein